MSSTNKGWFEPCWTPMSVEEDDGIILPGLKKLFEKGPIWMHPNSAKFHEYLEEVGALHDKKQSDYGRAEDPFANVRASEEWGIDGWVGAMVRLNDKVRRLQSLAQTGQLSNEGAIDSFMDIACYSLIARVLFEDSATL